jgi:hypothetical protein
MPATASFPAYPLSYQKDMMSILWEKDHHHPTQPSYPHHFYRVLQTATNRTTIQHNQSINDATTLQESDPYTFILAVSCPTPTPLFDLTDHHMEFD